MTRINAGSTLANQFAPPFVVSDQVTTNWQLRFNKTLLAFEAFDPNENVVVAGFNEIESQLFFGVTNQQTFVLPWVTTNRASLYITIQGVKQHTDTFTINTGANTTTVVLGGPATGDVEFIGLQTIGGVIIELFNDVGDNSKTDFLIGFLAPSEESLLVTIDGIRQHTNTYEAFSNDAFTDTTVRFDVAPASGETIEIVGIATTGEIPASPVNATNLAGGFDVPGAPFPAGHARIFASKTVSGENQIFNFRDLFAGTNITLTEGANSITIDTIAPTFNNIGTGIPIAPTPGTTDPLDLRRLDSGNGIQLSVVSDTIIITEDNGYGTTGNEPTITMGAAERVQGILNTSAPVTVTLPAIANVPAGDMITVKDQTGGADGTNTITVTPAGAELIDGAGTHVINTNFGFVTLYSDGINYFIIAEA